MHDARKLIAGVILALAAGPATTVTVYQCEDDKGNRTFESACPPGTKEVQQKDYAADGGAAAAEGSTEALAEITMYEVPDCEACAQIREFLDLREIAYTTKDVKDDVVLQGELKKRSGELRAPTVLVGEKAIVGYNRAALLAALQEAGHIVPDEGETEVTETGTAEPGAETENPAP